MITRTQRLELGSGDYDLTGVDLELSDNAGDWTYVLQLSGEGSLSGGAIDGRRGELGTGSRRHGIYVDGDWTLEHTTVFDCEHCGVYCPPSAGHVRLVGVSASGCGWGGIATVGVGGHLFEAVDCTTDLLDIEPAQVGAPSVYRVIHCDVNDLHVHPRNAGDVCQIVATWVSNATDLRAKHGSSINVIDSSLGDVEVLNSGHTRIHGSTWRTMRLRHNSAGGAQVGQRIDLHNCIGHVNYEGAPAAGEALGVWGAYSVTVTNNTGRVVRVDTDHGPITLQPGETWPAA